MLRMILADDEPVITRGIQKLLDWKSLGISIVGVYEDGKAAMEAILSLRPDIALLDINMPGMNGIEILKNLREFGIEETSVIFISGFQDFSYARSALTYGAADYLLKPVIREELVRALNRALSGKGKPPIGENGGNPREEAQEAAENPAGTGTSPENPAEARTSPETDEKTRYLPMVVSAVLTEPNGQMRRLMEFSVRSALTEEIEKKNSGILFEKEGNTVVVLRGDFTDEEFHTLLYDLWKTASEAVGKELYFFCGKPVSSMREIPGEYRRCVDLSRYLFFAAELPEHILSADRPVFARSAGYKELQEATAAVTNALVSHQQEDFDRAWTYFCRTLCLASDGRREDACYYFCSTIRVIDAQMTAMHIAGRSPEMRDLLEGGRKTADYREMCAYFRKFIDGYNSEVKNSVEGNDRKDIAEVQQYVEKHYREPITLATAADLIHVNSFYFSSLFKKKTGQNFKDYVNSVRLRQAVALLLSSDLKLYEIAEQTGFRDVRSLNDVFSKTYGETPAAYRKRILSGS